MCSHVYECLILAASGINVLNQLQQINLSLTVSSYTIFEVTLQVPNVWDMISNKHKVLQDYSDMSITAPLSNNGSEYWEKH
jgi:hypothetical protein